MYLIAHLQDGQAPGIKEEVSVSPGQLVAYSGKTGTSVEHLHVSYYDVHYNIFRE
jgi:murein DD-endopeptidase MepM/ murein hydrolase activator NlpD